MKGILKLSKTAPTPAIHFLLSELPVEAKLHKDIFSLFYNVWCNPDTKIHQIVKYLLQQSSENSRTWAIHVRHLSKMYCLEDPLVSLSRDPPSKSEYKQLVSSQITRFHEKELRKLAEENSRMKYMHVGLLGLSGRHHPIISGALTTDEVRKMRPHLKMDSVATI